MIEQETTDEVVTTNWVETLKASLTQTRNEAIAKIETEYNQWMHKLNGNAGTYEEPETEAPAPGYRVTTRARAETETNGTPRKMRGGGFQLREDQLEKVWTAIAERDTRLTAKHLGVLERRFPTDGTTWTSQEIADSLDISSTPEVSRYTREALEKLGINIPKRRLNKRSR